MIFEENDAVLLIGDSITDCGRNRNVAGPNDPSGLGCGYAAHAAAALLSRHPVLNLKVYNRGIGGDRVTNLRDRWEKDCLALKPDVLSVLIGINDTWHGVAKGTPENGVGLKAFDAVYRTLLDQAKDRLPGVKLVICEPFTAQAGAVLQLDFHPDVDRRREIVKRIADDYRATWVPFHTLYHQLADEAPPAYWAGDGVHPSPAGHQRMADAWLRATGA